MEAIGVVESIDGNYVNVRIKRESACGGNCADCSASCQSGGQIVRAVNKAGADVGNKVVMRMDTKKVLAAAFMVYILPIVSLFVVYGVVFSITADEIMSTVFSIISMCLFFTFMHIADKKLKDKYTLIAVSVL